MHIISCPKLEVFPQRINIIKRIIKKKRAFFQNQEVAAFKPPPADDQEVARILNIMFFSLKKRGVQGRQTRPRKDRL